MNHRTATNITAPATPPTTPPAIAPVLLDEAGFASSVLLGVVDTLVEGEEDVIVELVPEVVDVGLVVDVDISMSSIISSANNLY